jgi:hypothetical protein
MNSEMKTTVNMTNEEKKPTKKQTTSKKKTEKTNKGKSVHARKRYEPEPEDTLGCGQCYACVTGGSHPCVLD